MKPFTWMSPGTVTQAAAVPAVTVADAMADGTDETPAGGIYKAGGIDVLDLLKEDLLSTRRLVNLRQIPGLEGIASGESGEVRIGALTTLARVAADPVLQRHYPALVAAVGSSASPQIRHVATLGGNLLQRPRCWYFRSREQRCLRKGGAHCFALTGENAYHAVFRNQRCAMVHPSTAATVLVALGATLGIAGPGGVARRVTLESFLVPPEEDVLRENRLQPQEVLTDITLPPLGRGVRMAHLRQGQKDTFDWPLADVAAVLDIGHDHRCRQASIVLGAAAPIPHRSKPAEAALTGQRIDAATASHAARAALEGATPLSANAYKLPLFETLVRRAILQAVKPG